ncbi:glycoside hydrolase superfamily [Roridomyces roridus]|uniref:glucan 1,3-beta-glucosidase n=1 Tax=Roridomyces roridus TaxID=1738132 RepID=A0AAD7FHM6_9AGAR|nr:glycoside hydrolase superfamily [Roridomyces roridus]
MLGWARKYGLRVNLDLHTIPGSQNGYNHSGKFGQVNFLNGQMGVANAQRALDYIRTITEFISQPEWKNLIPVFGIVNEALLHTIGRPQLTSFYLEAHDMIRGITGYGEGNGPYILIHDGFDGVPNWAGFLQGSDRIVLDMHPYFAFDGLPNDAPIATGTDPSKAGGIWPKQQHI